MYFDLSYVKKNLLRKRTEEISQNVGWDMNNYY